MVIIFYKTLGKNLLKMTNEKNTEWTDISWTKRIIYQVQLYSQT